MSENTQEKYITPMKAIRAKCLDCSLSNPNEVRLCTVTRCPLYAFRLGHNPNIKPRTVTDEQLMQLRRMCELASNNRATRDVNEL